MSRPQVFITGASGYLGTCIARYYLEQTNHDVHLWIHAGSDAEFGAKYACLLQRFAGHEQRLIGSWGDLTGTAPFAGVPPEQIQTIIHSAAVTRFNVDRLTAQAVNVDGTRKVLDFAAHCPSLQQVGLISTIYSSGLQAGVIDEVIFHGAASFSNHYEQSKWAAETLLFTEYARLPWRLFRLGTIIADDVHGGVTQHNAFHNTLKLLYYGLLSLIPGYIQTPLYFVTGDFASQAVFEGMRASPNQAIYHVSHTKQESISLQALVDIVFDIFSREAEFTRRRVLKPLYADQETFDLLVESVQSFSTRVLNQAVSSIAPFSRQLFINKEIVNSRLVSMLSSYSAPNSYQLIEQTCSYLVQSRWGRMSYHAV